jgi:3-isopropylmalate/(R)-2-methylmalate dehydratase small subunit
MPSPRTPITGKVWRFSSDISTDDIISGVHLNRISTEELIPYVFEHLRPDFIKKVQPGDIIVANEHFGIGSSREEAPAILVQIGIRAVVAASFARIFFRNAFNLGIPAVEFPELGTHPEIVREGDMIEIHLEAGTLINHRTKKCYNIVKIPSFLLEYIDSGGAIPVLKQKLKGR